MKKISFNLKIIDGHIDSVVFLNEKKEREVLDFNKNNFKKIKSVFEDKTILKCGYDLKKDIKTLSTNKINLKPPIFDTLIAAYLIEPGKRNYGLEKLSINNLEKELQENGLIKLFEDIEMPLIFVLLKMEENGIKIDEKYLKKMSLDFKKDLDILTKKIYKIAGQEFNIKSPAQLKEILFEKLKISTKGIRKTSKKGELSTAAKELERLKDAHPIIDLIITYRELQKLKSTYIDALPKLINPKTKRVHTSFNQTITATGRLSSSNPNLQNIPTRTEIGKEIRKAFVAENGNLLLAIDYSQVELRIIAHIANDEKMIDAFNSGVDIHTRTAAEVNNINIEDVTKDMRRAAKAVNFGIMYGMGARSLAESTGMTTNEATEFINKYFEMHPKIKDYLDETKSLARAMGYVETLFGRRRYLPEIVSYYPAERAMAERMAINHPIQGTAADIIKLAMIEINKKLRYKMLLQVHDELIFEIPKKDIKKATKEITEIMENVVKLKVPIIADTKVGLSWGDMKKL